MGVAGGRYQGRDTFFVVVMYAGRVAETGTIEEIFENPMHPYTMGLLSSLPDRAPPGARLPTIDGTVPSPLNFPSGCRFLNRCERASEKCSEVPPLVELGEGHKAWCHHPYQEESLQGGAA